MMGGGSLGKKRKGLIIGVFLLVWSSILLVNLVKEILSILPLIRSRHHFYESCSHDYTHRTRYLEACTVMETRPIPTNWYLDVLFEAIPRVKFFVFFEFHDLFSYQVISKMVALAICRMVCGDVIVFLFRLLVKQSKRIF